MNRRIPNGTYGGVGGRELGAPSYPIAPGMGATYKVKVVGGRELGAPSYPIKLKILATICS